MINISKLFHKPRNVRGELFATFFYSGLIKYSSGTFGSFLTLLLCILLYIYGPGTWSITMLFFISTLYGYIKTRQYVTLTGRDDPKEVVIDEVSGQSLSIIIFILYYKQLGFEASNMFILLNFTLSFALFRFFDITKIFPVSYFDNLKGAFGVMSDDVVAAIMAGIAHIIILYYVM